MSSELERSENVVRDMQAADDVVGVASALRGVSEALAYRAEVEDDDMLVLMAGLIDEQAEVLRGLARKWLGAGKNGGKSKAS